MKAALTKKAESLTGDVRTLLRDKNIRHAGISARRQRRRRALPRQPRRWPRRARCWPTSCPTCTGSKAPDGADFKLVGSLKPEAARAVQDGGDHAEHHDAAQPRQRARRGRAGDPAAGRRPRRRPAAGRAGHGQGEGHHRPHRDARAAHGRRQQPRRAAAERRRPGAVRHRALRRARRRAADRQAPGAC